MNNAVRFAWLFRGRYDAYGVGDSHPYAVREPVTLDTYVRHLEGKQPIGIYPIHECGVHWGCVDIDEQEPNHALNLRSVLAKVGVSGVIEKSRSKGFHVWVFNPPGDEGIEPHIMRRALYVACQIAEVPPKEVNPKQEQLGPDELGNFVRLPYPSYGLGGTQVFLDLQLQPLNFPQALDLAYEAAAFTAYSGIAELASYFVEPPKLREVELHEDVELDAEIEAALRGITRTIWLQGDKGDRSQDLWRLAQLCEGDGFTADEALAIVADADWRWGKYQARDGHDGELRRIVTKVYGK